MNWPATTIVVAFLGIVAVLIATERARTRLEALSPSSQWRIRHWWDDQTQTSQALEDQADGAIRMARMLDGPWPEGLRQAFVVDPSGVARVAIAKDDALAYQKSKADAAARAKPAEPPPKPVN